MAVDLSYLQPYFEALSAVPHLLNQQQQAEQQQDLLAETQRHNMADEDVAGRHADIAEAAQRQTQQQNDLQNALTIRNNGFKPLTMGDDGQAYDPSAGGAPVPGTVGVTQGQVTPVTQGVARVDTGSGAQPYQIPTWQEEHARTLQQGIDDHAVQNQARLGSEGWTIPDEMADTLGITKGSKVLPEHVGALVQLHNTVSPPEKQFAPPADKPTVKLTAQDSKLMGVPAGTVMPLEEYKARGAVVSEGARAARGEGGASAEKPATKAQFSQVAKDKATALAQSGKQLDKDLAGAQKSYAADDTFDRVGAIKQAYADHKARLQAAQNSYEERVGQLSGNDVGHNDWADKLGTEAAPAAAAVPAAGGRGGAAAVPKVASMADVSAYATQFSKSKSDALKDFQAKGYKIGAQ